MATAAGSSARPIVFKGKRIAHAFAAFAMPDIRHEPEVGDGWVRFVQTDGRADRRYPRPAGCDGRRSSSGERRSAWTTLSLTLHADGRAESTIVGASRFPRHWIYGTDGGLVAKTGMTEFKDW